MLFVPRQDDFKTRKGLERNYEIDSSQTWVKASIQWIKITGNLSSVIWWTQTNHKTSTKHKLLAPPPSPIYQQWEQQQIPKTKPWLVSIGNALLIRLNIFYCHWNHGIGHRLDQLYIALSHPTNGRVNIWRYTVYNKYRNSYNWLTSTKASIRIW